MPDFLLMNENNLIVMLEILSLNTIIKFFHVSVYPKAFSKVVTVVRGRVKVNLPFH